MKPAIKVRWEEMFPDELERAVAACPLAWLSFGCLERHGPHMAVGNDALQAHAICVRAAERFGGVVTPPSYWHIGGDEAEYERRWLAGMGHPNLWGLYLTPDLFYPLFIALLRQAEMLGFQAVMAVSGHAGPDRDMRLIAEHYMQRSPLRVGAVGWWDAIAEPAHHGGKVETSQLLHLYPDLVDMGRLPADRTRLLVARECCYDATPEAGRRLVEAEVEWLGQKALELLAQYRPRPGHQVMARESILPFWLEIKAAEKDRLVEWT